MRIFFLLALLFLACLAPVNAQDISIEHLLNLTELADGHSADLNEWTFRPDTPQAAEERLTWSWRPVYEPDSVGPPALQLSLRPAPHGYDVLLYVKRMATYNQLRRELEKQHLTPVPVTCLGVNCLGFRFNTPTCTVAFYEGKAGDYPYVIVVQPKAGRPPLPEPPLPAGQRPQTVRIKLKGKAGAPPPNPAAPASARR